jgi:hypothetical protein
VAGVVESEVYVGSLTTYGVKIASGDILTIRQQNVQTRLGGEALPPGSQVSLSWAVDACRIFTD